MLSFIEDADRKGSGSNNLSTVRTVFEVFMGWPAAVFAAVFPCMRIGLAGSGELRTAILAAVTHHKGLALFDTKNGNKKQIKIMIHTCIIRL